jgi:hypothetical protein
MRRVNVAVALAFAVLVPAAPLARYEEKIADDAAKKRE